jgi:phage-related protein
MADGSLKFDTKIDTEGIDKGTRSIKGSLNSFLQSVRNMGRGVESAFSGTASIDKADSKIRMLVDEIDQLSDGLYYLEKQGMYFGDKEYDEAYSKLQRLEKELNTYKKSLAGVDTAQKKTSKSVAKVGKNMDRTTKSTNNGHMSMMKMLKMSLLFSVVFRALSAVTKAIGEGFQNLAQYSKQTNKDLSTLATSGQTLKNSFATAFAPILTAITPALKSLIDHLSQAITVAGQFFAVFFNGASTFTRAKDAQIDYAKSLQKTAKDANKALSPIDKLNMVGDDAAAGSGATDPKDMFETVSINPAIASTASGIANAIKTSFSSLLTWFTTSFGPTFSKIWTNLQAPLTTFKSIASGVFTDLLSLGQPLASYFTGPFTTYLNQVFTSLETIVVGLFDTFNRVFSDIWNIAVFPMVQKFITSVLPILTAFSTEAWSLLQEVFTGVKTIFDMIWSDAIAPALEIAVGIWMDFVDILIEFWNKWGKPIFDGIKLAWNSTVDLFVALWNKFLKPIWDTFMKTVDKLWKDHLKPLLANFMDFVGEFVTGALEIYNKFIAPLVKWFVEKLGPPISKVISYLITNIGDFLGGIVDAVSGIITALKGVVQFISGVFTGDWEKAWKGIQNIFKGIWDALVNIVKTPINLIIDLINGMISGIVTGLNAIIDAANKISIKAPDWLGGKTYGIQLNRITAPKIPKLATGAVIPPNSEFLALLGDQKRGTNIEAPLDTIVEAFRQVAGNSGNMLHVTLMMPNGKVLFDTVVAAEKENYNQTGEPAFLH